MDDSLSSLVPLPLVVRPAPGWYRFAAGTPVVAARGAERHADAVRRALGPVAAPCHAGPSGPLAADGQAAAGPRAPGTGAVAVERAPGLAAEAYRLSIGPDGVKAEAGGVPGAFYAGQTLKQLLGADAWRAVPASREWPVPCAEIADAPALAWRGAHLDVARHFFPKRELLTFIDAIAAHKLNTLHLHLTDDQGWRVESRAHPALHEVGSCRTKTMISAYDEHPARYDHTPHGGYYTLADLAEVHAYAAQRMVSVVPAIEVPGHSSALLAAAPELGVGRRARYHVGTDWGIIDSLVSPLPATTEFVAEVLGELLGAVPAGYVHLGGDECLLDGWRHDERVEDYRRSLGLASAEDLQVHFLRGLADLLAAQGARAVVWDEAFTNSAEGEAGRLAGGKAGLRADTVVMAWHGMDVARQAAQAGHAVVLAPETATYFDHAQSPSDREPPALGAPVPLADVAAFSPLPGDWPAEAAGQVLGTQFQLWTERIRDSRHLEYMAFPRACALAEVAWTGAATPAEPLAGRLAAHLPRLDALGVAYRPLGGPHPWQQAGPPRRVHSG